MSSIDAAALPSIPAAVAARGIALRPESTTDRDFLSELFVQTRWEQLQPTTWTDQQKVAFLVQQFTFQDAHYTRHYEGAARGIITRNAETIGRLYLYALQGELRMVDISLLSVHRSQGIGAALIAAVLDEGQCRGNVVTLHVEAFNRARHLYQRLGFIDVGGDSIYRKMAWRPAASEQLVPQSKTAS